DLLNLDPKLGPLQDNGGPTLTHALLPGSPALDAGDNAGAPTHDQRGPGFPRIFGGTIDIGAFEVQTQLPPAQGTTLTVSGFTVTITAGVAGSFTATATTAEGSTNTISRGTVQFTSSDPQAVLPSNYPFPAADRGAHPSSAALKTAGSQSITASDTMVPG